MNKFCKLCVNLQQVLEQVLGKFYKFWAAGAVTDSLAGSWVPVAAYTAKCLGLKLAARRYSKAIGTLQSLSNTRLNISMLPRVDFLTHHYRANQ